MQLINDTRMVAGHNMGLEVSGRELLVVVIKGTFVLPRPGEQVRLADAQLPLILAEPSSLSVVATREAMFHVEAGGSGPVFFQ